MNIFDITNEAEKAEQLIRLAAYCRVSSDSEDQLHSFAAQIRYYKDYEKKHPQYKLVDIYADEGLTGTSMSKRDDLNRLIRDCKRGLIDRIIVKSVSRFARNTEELLMMLRMLKDMNVSVYFEEQDIDTEKLNMEMIVTFPGMAAQKESETISGNLRWSYKKRMESGEFNCCAPAYGFNMKKGKLVINEEEAKVVRRIFDMYLNGMGKQKIATILNNENIPRRYGHSKWRGFTIHYILNNERYKGDALLQKKYTTDTLPYQKVVNHGEKAMYYVENANQAIVSRETYDAAQELQKIRNIHRAERKRTLYPLTGLLRCPDCGHVFRRQIVNGIPYWLCSSLSSGETNCIGRRLREQSVYDAFISMYEKLTEYRKSLLGTLIRDMKIMQNNIGAYREQIAEIDKQIADLASQNLVISRLHTNGILNAADYTVQTSVINTKITDLRAERKKKLTEDTGDEKLDELKELYKILECSENIENPSIELTGQIVKQITVVSNAELTFRLLGDVELTENIPEKGRCKLS